MRLVLFSDDRIEALLRAPFTKAGFTLSHVTTSAGVVSACQEKPAPFAAILSVATATEAEGLLTAYRALLGASVPPLLFILVSAEDHEVARLEQAGAAGVYPTPVAGRMLLRQLQALAARADTPVETRRPRAPGSLAPAAAISVPVAKVAVVKAGEGPEHSLDSIVEQALLSRPSQGFDISLSGLDVSDEVAPPASDPVWPGRLPSVDECRELLAARTAGAPMTGSVREALVAETWRSLSHAEIAALEALCGKGSREAAESPRTAALASIAGTRLRLAEAADRLARSPRAVLDEAGVLSLKQEIDRALKEVLDPTLNAAVAQGDMNLMRDFRAIRKAFTGRRHDLDRYADRLRGQATQQPIGALDEAVPEPDPVPQFKSRLFGTRLLHMTTVTAEAARRHAPMLFVTLAVVGATVLALHAFVFDSFHLNGGPERIDSNVEIAGVASVEYFGTMARASVGSSFDRVEGVKALLRKVAQGSTLVVVTEEGTILDTVAPDRAQELLAAASLPPAAPPERVAAHDATATAP